MAKIAIHGFGRIGRIATRAALSNNLFTPVSFSDIQDLATLGQLFKADSNYGLWPEQVSTDGSGFHIGDRHIPYYNSREKLPDWGDLGVEVVVDCTGRATRREIAQQHIDAGARRVL